MIIFWNRKKAKSKYTANENSNVKKKKSQQVSTYEELNTRSHLGMETIIIVHRTAITWEIKKEQTIHTYSLDKAI